MIGFKMHGSSHRAIAHITYRVIMVWKFQIDPRPQFSKDQYVFRRFIYPRFIQNIPAIMTARNGLGDGNKFRMSFDPYPGVVCFGFPVSL